MMVETKSQVHEKLLFLYKFVCSSRQIGSVTPSSRYRFFMDLMISAANRISLQYDRSALQ
ncbi:hypothetical protein [Paenibacillus sp. FSL H8-0034]|uniref:hypothetical protein n=1 Tax=Paenibacillus sp. FSL H8-0034 TaxID=2954671 RepID=UPI0030FB3077